MNKPLFTGVCTALVTPFLDGKINYPMVEKLLHRQLDAGIQAIVVAGTTGEAPTLTEEEKLKLFARCKEYVGNRCKIIAGTGSNSTAHTIDLSQAAEACGVDGLLVVSPYYNKANADGLTSHYTMLSRNVTIPIILYNVPSRTGVDIPVSVYKHLSKIPNIVGVKEASGDIVKQIRIITECDRHFTVWTGNDSHIVPTIAIGGQGVISVLSNICPYETNEMTKAALANDFAEARTLQNCLLPLMDAMFCDINPIPVKYAMQLIGYDCGECRLPLTSLPSKYKNAIADLLNK